MHRFFVNKKNILENQEKIIIDDLEDIKHIYRVLRLGQGENLEVCDGENHDFIGEILSIEKSKITLNIIEKRMGNRESNVEITLFQGIPKSTKMETVIQKCTELGIFKIVPMITERTVVQLKDKKAEDKKIERWQKIADSAAKQSKRGIIPKIDEPITFQEMLKILSQYDLSIIPYEKEDSLGMKGLLKDSHNFKKVAIMIGPEGGFEEGEILKAKDYGAISVTLGPRILRTETAGFVALSILMYEIGDLGGI